MSWDYWLGVVTLPILFGLGWALIFAWWWVTYRLEKHFGITFEAKLKRAVDEISEHTLKHNIWWERPFGPVFVGGWYRQRKMWRESEKPVITRWFGVGSVHGPCVMIYKKEELA